MSGFNPFNPPSSMFSSGFGAPGAPPNMADLLSVPRPANTFGPQYKSTKKASERIELLLDEHLNRIEQFEFERKYMTDFYNKHGINEGRDLVGNPYDDIDKDMHCVRTDQDKDRCLAAILAAILTESKADHQCVTRLVHLVFVDNVSNGGYILPLELMVRRLGQGLLFDKQPKTQSIALQAIASLCEFTSQVLTYINSGGFWRMFKQALESTNNKAFGEDAVELLKSVNHIDENAILDQRLYDVFLKRFDFLEDFAQSSVITLLSFAIRRANLLQAKEIIIAHEILESMDFDHTYLNIEFLQWSLSRGYDKYGALFGKREFNALLKLFDSQWEMHIKEACSISMMIIGLTPEKVFDPSAMIEKIAELYFDDQFNAKFPKCGDDIHLASFSAASMLMPMALQRPGTNSPVRGTMWPPTENVIFRSEPIPFPDTVSDGCRIFSVAFKIIKKYIEVEAPHDDQVYVAQPIINGLNYIHRKESDKFVDFVRSSGVLEYIASVSLKSPNIVLGSLNSFSECILECADEPALHELIKKTKVIEILQVAIQKAMRTAGNSERDQAMLKSKRISSICLGNLKDLRSKLYDLPSEPAESSESAIELINSIRTPQFNPRDLEKVSVKSLFDAEFLTKVNCEDFAKFLSVDFVNVLHKVIDYTIEYSEMDFNMPIEEYIDSITLEGPLRGTRVSLPVKNCPVPHPEVVNVYAITLGAVHEMTHFIREDRIAGIYSNYPEFERLIATKDIKYTWNGMEIPPYLPTCAVVQGDPHHKVPIYEIEFVDKGYEANCFPEESVYGRNAFSKKKLSETAVYALDTLKNLFLANQKANYKLPLETFHNEKLNNLFVTMLDYRVMHFTFTIPQWMFTIVSDYQFVLPFDIRHQFLDATVFLCKYYKHHLSQDFMLPVPFSQQCSVFGFSVHDHKPRKFRIKRGDMLEAGSVIIDKTDNDKKPLEVIYSGEEGVGRGPTAEFFALCSKAFSEPDSGMWIDTPLGLMPRFYGEKVPKQIVHRFATLGRLVTRSLYGRHLLDIKISPLFFETLLNCDSEPEEQIKKYDRAIAKTFDTLKTASREDIASMHLTFIEPRTGTDLIANGSSTAVTKDNVEEYIESLTDAYIGPGIFKQVATFRKGMHGKLTNGNLKTFTPLEWSLFCGNKDDEPWDKAYLDEHIVIDHRIEPFLTIKQYLIQYLTQLDTIGRRKFLEFATGSPRLPLNGFSGLDPKFKIDILDLGLLPNPNSLPIVLTCMNSLRTPLYTSYEVFEAKLNLAIQESAHSFTIE